MKNIFIYCTLLCIMLVGCLYGCKKEHAGGDSNIIEVPYTLYYSDTAGVLYSTNNGTDSKIIFSADGSPCRAICVSGNNILWLKNNLYVSMNGGKNFNHGFDSLPLITHKACNGVRFGLNQSMIVDMPEWNKVFTVNGSVHDPSAESFNYLGVEYTNNHGIRGSFAGDGSYDTTGRVGMLPVAMVSYTRLANGLLSGLAISKYRNAAAGVTDTTNFRILYKQCGTDHYDCGWKETTGRATYNATDTTGVPLPPTVAYPDTGFFTLGHFNNRLIAIDQSGYNGAFYSDDTGRIWKKYAGLPSRVPLLCVQSPFEQLCLIGTYGMGLYKLDANGATFFPNNSGLGSNLVVRSIAAKENIYKNKTKKRHIYLATNRGIYQSADDGVKWVLTIPGNFVAVY